MHHLHRQINQEFPIRVPGVPGLLLLVLLITELFFPLQIPAQHAEPQDVRIGIVASDDFAEELAHWRRYFAECNEKSGQKYHFRIAPGTYGDLLHWMEKGQLDLAVVTAGVFSQSLSLPDEQPRTTRWSYLGTLNLGSNATPAMTGQQEQSPTRYHYRSHCLVPIDSPIQTLDDLKKNAAEGLIEYIFVDPLSVSGRIVPETALRQAGIAPDPRFIRYSYSHTASLRVLTRTSGSQHRVGFVWEGAFQRLPELKQKLRIIEFPQLSAMEIPHDVIALRDGFSPAAELGQLLLDITGPDGEPIVHRLPGGVEQYRKISSWMEPLEISRWHEHNQFISLGDIGQILQHAIHTQPAPPKLALVLSGGGAKCAYQVGAVSIIEERLARLQKHVDRQKIDINTVVGTSGGAFNAIPIALGITRTAEGRADFVRMWQALDQRRMLRPFFPVRFILGLWVALLQGLIIWLALKLIMPRGSTRTGTFFILLSVMALIDTSYLQMTWTPWRLLGSDHLLHHLVLWLGYGVDTAPWILVTVSIGGLLWHWSRRGKPPHMAVKTRRLAWTAVGLIFFLPMLHFGFLLFYEPTLSDGDGIVDTLHDRYVELIDNELQRRNLPLLSPRGQMDTQSHLALISQEIFDRGLLERDVIVTTSCLSQSRAILPSDLYFYTALHGDNAVFGARGICLNSYPERLMDVVMGSVSLFPVYPGRKLRDFPEAGVNIELVDGGFAHNSPIEAAVLTGATHIILIESTADRQGPRRNLAENASAAIDHLHKQTQLVDLRSKQQVVVFTLVPEETLLCVLDFADNLVEAAIARGESDVLGRFTAADGTEIERPRFRKELGEPVFTEL